MQITTTIQTQSVYTSTTREAGLPKNSSKNQLSDAIINQTFVQSPLWTDVRTLLSDMSYDDAYISRGEGTAKSLLKNIIKSHREWISSIIDVSQFKYAYMTSGITEALNVWRLSDDRPIQMFDGDYQYPAMIGSDPRVVTSFDDVSPDEVLYISTPSAATGNYVDIPEIDCPVILDCAYIGSTAASTVSVPKNTEQVMFGFSKGWGTIGQRLGIVYTKRPHPVLERLKRVECFNYNNLFIIERLMEEFTITEMHERALESQLEICSDYDLDKSDVYFIANSTDDVYAKRRRTGTIARLCISPLMKFDGEEDGN